MSRPIAFWLAVAVAALTIAIAIRVNTFTPWGTDAAAYIEEAHRWEAGELFAPLPLQLWAPWMLHDWSVAPYGFRPGVERGTEVGQYPLGLPVLMAAAIRLGGPLAAYVVPPIAAGLLVWCAYLIASAVGGHWAGLLAAVVMAASPITLVFAVQPMSDVPAAAFWALSWAVSLRPGLGAAAAAGAASATAVMIRPNLAPLALVIAGLQFVQRKPGSAVGARSLARVAMFVSVASLGPLIVAWSHTVLYGSPFRSGYLAQEYLFSLSYVPTNLGLYPGLLMTAHTALIFVGLVAAGLMWWSPIRARVDTSARRVAWSAVALVTVNFLLYLAYVPLPDPAVVRFVLPAFTALVVLFAGSLVHVSRALFSKLPGRVALCALPVAIVLAYPADYLRYAIGQRIQQAHVRISGPYLDAALTPNAAIITSVQGAALAHFTKRLIVRFDALDRTALDGVVAELRRRGYHPVVVLDGAAEESWFRAHFAPSPLQRLDWPPRAIVHDATRYWDFADRDAHARGLRWPTDIINSRQ